jgi:AcrR family transcriptional regulator
MGGTDAVDRVRRGRGRRPAAEVRREVLAAAGALLFDSGLGAVTFDKVAASGAASKMTLYKWWPSPGSLALEAYFAAVEETLAFPDTNDVERDLAAQLHAFVRLLTEERAGQVMAELIGAAQSDPALATALTSHYTLPRRRLAVERLSRAQDRGQIHRDVDPEVVVDQLWGACYHRLLLPAEPLGPDFVDALVRNLFRGIRA